MTEKHTISVITHDGYKANERPAVVFLDGRRLDVLMIEEMWLAAGVDPQSEIRHHFVVRCTGGARFRLLFTQADGWRGELIMGPRLVPDKEV